MENGYKVENEDKALRGKEVPNDNMELFTVYLSGNGLGIDVALPEEIDFMVNNNKNGKFTSKLEEAFRYLKPVIDGVAVALAEAMEEQGLVDEETIKRFK